MPQEREHRPSPQVARTIDYLLGVADTLRETQRQDPFLESRRKALMAQEMTIENAVKTGQITREQAREIRVGQLLRAEQESGLDYLTGLRNRRSFLHDGEAIIQRAVRSGDPVSFLAFDIDHFKAINDTEGQGHDVGDAVIHQVGGYLGNMLRRPYDIVGRLGGDEFAAILAETEGRDAMKVAERLNRDVDNIVGPAVRETGLNLGQTIKFSIGVTSTDITGVYDLEHLKSSADVALYVSKDQGRGRATLFRNPSK